MGGAGVAGSSSGPSVHEFIDISQNLGYRAVEMGGNLLADFNRYGAAGACFRSCQEASMLVVARQGLKPGFFRATFRHD